MKTLTFKKMGCTLVDTSAPAPARGQVLLRLRGTLLDETHLADYRAGTLQAPYLVCGVILQPGPGVIDFKRGQAVVAVVAQPLSQYLLVDQTLIYPVEHAQGASCMLMGIALAKRAVKQAEKYPESTVIGGAGFIGLTLSALLKTTTPWVFGTSDQALMCARDLGAAHCKEWVQVAEDLKREESGDRGYGATMLETTGRLEERQLSQFLTLKGGTVVCVTPPGPGSDTLEVDAYRIHYDQITWVALGPCGTEDIVKAGTMLDRIPDMLITDQLPFDKLEYAFEELDAERAVCFLLTDGTDT
jgi:threonine dehydrogenase-like Zn-dependent dehydrogenase